MSDIIKEQSYALTKALKKLGIKLSHGNALEVMAQVHGAESWNHVLAAQSQTKSAREEAAGEVQKQAALTEAGRVLAEQVAANFERANVLDAEQHASLLVAGDAMGTPQATAIIGPSAHGMAKAQFHLLSQLGSLAQVYLKVSLVMRGGRVQVAEALPVRYEDLANAAIEVAVRPERHLRKLTQCPLSRLLQHRDNSKFRRMVQGVGAFIDGEDFPLHKFVVPDRVWGACQQPGNDNRFTLTIGETVAAYLQHSAEVTA